MWWTLNMLSSEPYIKGRPFLVSTSLTDHGERTSSVFLCFEGSRSDSLEHLSPDIFPHPTPTQAFRGGEFVGVRFSDLHGKVYDYTVLRSSPPLHDGWSLLPLRDSWVSLPDSISYFRDAPVPNYRENKRKHKLMDFVMNHPLSIENDIV